MADLHKLYLFRMTHIENVPHILQHGITHISSPSRNPSYVPIGDGSLINTRNAYPMPNGRRLGEYIPFYFGGRMPMLYVVQKGFNGVPQTRAEDIVYVISTVARIIAHQLNFVFTDGHAVDGFSSFYEQDKIADIFDIIDQKAIGAQYWKDDNDLDLKRRKEAEFLVAEDIPVSAIAGYGVYNEAAKKRLMNIGLEEQQVAVRPTYYF